MIRKPEWVEEIGVESANGAPIRQSEEDGYIAVQRAWRPGDAILIRYRMPLRVKTGDDNRVTCSVGPWLLGASASDNPEYFNELMLDNKVDSGSAREIAAAPAFPFAVPIAARSMRFTPAEYPDQPRTVNLRAIAEQTAQPTTAWEIRLPAQQKS